MSIDRRALLAASGAGAIAAALAGCAREQTESDQTVVTVTPATLERSQGTGAAFVPRGEYRTHAADFGYVEEEWFASGVDDSGKPYKTYVFIRRPSDLARFSGVVLIEPLHATSAAPIYMYTGAYIMRSGHGWACVASQKTPLDDAVKPTNAERYASLRIEAETRGARAPSEEQAAGRAVTARFNQASNAILAQTSAAIRAAAGPFGPVQHLVMIGHSQTGGVVRNYILGEHDTHRLEGGARIIDGFFPAGVAREAFGPRDAALLHLLSESDIDDGERSNGRSYRREDSDAVNDRYRLYELAGAPHMGTRYAPHNDPAHWIQSTGGAIRPTDKMSSYPHHEMFDMALSHLVAWVKDGTPPPRAARIETEPDGRFFAKDENGNSRGGVRCAQMDVPHATYHPDPEGAQAVVGAETPFDTAKMRRLYQTPANYAQRFNARLDALIGEGWFLAENAEDMRREAAAQRF